MPKFSISVDINQAPEIVWNAYIDPQNMTHYMKYLQKVETIEGEFGEIGAIARLHYLEKGRSYVLEDKLLEYESGKRIRSQVSGQGMNIEVQTTFKPIQGCTKISMDWNGKGKSLLMRFILRLMRGRICRQAKEELEDFKALIEVYGAKFPVT